MTARPIIASSLPETFNLALEDHAARPAVVRLPGAPWEIPPEADILVTFQSHWKTAPKEKPAGWPGGLKWMQVASAGVDTLPAWAYEVPVVSRAPQIQGPIIAEYVVGAVFAHEKRFWDGPVRSRQAWELQPLGGVAGKMLGIAGMGSIGSEVAKIALGVGLRVTALTRSSDIGMAGVERASDLHALFAACDHVVLTMPLTAETRNIIGADCLRASKPGLHLINVARGGLIDQEALITALDAGTLSAATLDVTEPEPLPEGHPLYTHPRVRLTPHASGSSEDTDARTSRLLCCNLDLFLAGRPLPYTISRGRGY